MKKILFTIIAICTFNFVYSQLPSALFNPTNNIFCPGLCTGFVNLSTNATSYQWIFQGGVPSTSTDLNPSIICYNVPGDYDVTLIAFNSLGSDTLVIPNCIHIYPYPPQIGIWQYGDTLRTNTGLVSYQWYLNGNLIPGATDYIYIATVAADYAMVAIDSNGCVTEAVLLNIYTDVEESVCEFSILPNPTSEYIEIKGCQFTGEVEIKIYNALGGIAKSETQNSPTRLIVDVTNLPKGIYFAEVKFQKRCLMKRIIIQ